MNLERYVLHPFMCFENSVLEDLVPGKEKSLRCAYCKYEKHGLANLVQAYIVNLSASDKDWAIEKAALL